jgi:hypothetical protein
MLTLFTIPKPFSGHIGVIQRNAIRSWTLLGDDVRVVLFGTDQGTADVAGECGAEHHPEVARNRFGTPLLGDLFARAGQCARSTHLCYVNADILLMSDFVASARRALRYKKRLLMVGQRVDFDQTEAIDFASDWESAFRAEVAARGVLHRPTGIDYFLYHRDIWGRIPPFAIGRFSWDNWLIRRARDLQVPVIDATPCITAVHQNHDYSHARGGAKGARGGPEARENFRLAGGRELSLTIWDSTHILTPAGLERRRFDAALGGGIWSYRRAVGERVA